VFSISGSIFFSIHTHDSIQNIIFIWICLVTSSSFYLFLMPISSILQGIGEIEKVYLMRILQNLLSVLIFFLFIYGHFGVMAVLSITLSGILVQIFYLTINHRDIFVLYLTSIMNDTALKATQEKFTSHVAISWLTGYLNTQFQTLIIFILLSVEISGKFGLTLAVLNTILLIASSKLHLYLPRMTSEGSKGNLTKLNKLFITSLYDIFVIYTIGLITLLAMFYFDIFHLFTSRLLSLDILLILSFALLLNQLLGCIVVYTRSFLVDPLFKLNTYSSIAILILSILSIKNIGVYGPHIVYNICAAANCPTIWHQNYYQTK